MKYNNKSELIETIKNNANLFIKEYSDIEETSMNKIDEEIEYSPFQMLAFCIGWMDLVLSWEDEEQ
ncbi:MAG: ClbS/DfsB family four-helix bundle protein, partial [Clostridia bacterium]